MLAVWLILLGDPAANGNALLRQGRCGDAIPLLRAATRAHADNALVWYDLGYCYRKTGQNREAAAAYQEYARLRPGSPDPYYGLGAALRALGDAAGARAAFEKYIALEKRPSEQRWVEKARQELRELLPPAAPPPLPPPKPVALPAVPKPAPKPIPPPPPPVAIVAPTSSLDIVRAAIADRRWPVARVELDSLLADHPDDVTALLLRADVRRAQGDSDGAAADAARALALRPTDPVPLRILGEALAGTDPVRSRYYLDLYRWAGN